MYSRTPFTCPKKKSLSSQAPPNTQTNSELKNQWFLEFDPQMHKCSAKPCREVTNNSNWWQLIRKDFQVIFDRDRSVGNFWEVFLCYSSWHALVIHRVSNWLWQQQIPFFPRFLSHLGRFLTGIEIHPGATIGEGVFIVNGTGVVIGETAIVGDYCQIETDVTLGGTGKETGKRHPTLGNNVLVGAGAKVLGNIRIGDRCCIAAGSVVLRNVPDDRAIAGIPGRIIKISSLEGNKIPDLEGKSIQQLLNRIEQLEKKVKSLQHL